MRCVLEATCIWGIQGKFHLDHASDASGGEYAAVYGLKVEFLQHGEILSRVGVKWIEPTDCLLVSSLVEQDRGGGESGVPAERHLRRRREPPKAESRAGGERVAFSLRAETYEEREIITI